MGSLPRLQTPNSIPRPLSLVSQLSPASLPSESVETAAGTGVSAQTAKSSESTETAGSSKSAESAFLMHAHLHTLISLHFKCVYLCPGAHVRTYTRAYVQAWIWPRPRAFEVKWNDNNFIVIVCTSGILGFVGWAWVKSTRLVIGCVELHWVQYCLSVRRYLFGGAITWECCLKSIH